MEASAATPAAAGGSRALHDATSASRPGARAASRPTRSVVRQPNEPSGQLSMPMWPPFGEVGHRERLVGRARGSSTRSCPRPSARTRPPGRPCRARASACRRRPRPGRWGRPRPPPGPSTATPVTRPEGSRSRPTTECSWRTGTSRPARARTRPTSTAVAAEPPSGVAPIGRPAARISSRASELGHRVVRLVAEHEAARDVGARRHPLDDDGRDAPAAQQSGQGQAHQAPSGDDHPHARLGSSASIAAPAAAQFGRAQRVRRSPRGRRPAPRSAAR